MEATLTRDECVALLRFARGVFPGSLGASAVLAVLHTQAIDDALLAEAAGEQAASLRGAVPKNESDAHKLVSLGWQAPVHDPDVVAGLVLLRPLPISAAHVEGLQAAAKLGGSAVEDRLARRADASLAEMADRVRRFELDDSERRVMAACDPIALEMLHRDRRDEFLRAACTWLVAAIEASWHEGWSAEASDAALRLIGRQVKYEESYFDTPAVRGLHAAFATLLGPKAAEVRRAALARVVTEMHERARSSHPLVARGIGRFLAMRGVLGIFERRNYHTSVPPPLRSPGQLEWLRRAGEREIVSAALQVISFDCMYSTVQALIEPEYTQAFERAVIERFEAAQPTSSQAWTLADALAKLGTTDATHALFRRLSREADASEVSEWALSCGTPAAIVDLELVALSVARDPVVALRATRALAARATSVAQARFEDLALNGAGLLRWIAIEGLGRLGRQSRSCEVLREALRRATPHEEQLILAVLPRCVQTRNDVAWTLDLPVRAELEEALSHCTAMVIAAALAEEPLRTAAPFDSKTPPASKIPEVLDLTQPLDRLVQLLVKDPRRILRWSLAREQVGAIVALLTRHLPDDDPLSLALETSLTATDDPPPAMFMRDVAPRAEAGPGGTPTGTTPPVPLRLAEATCFSVLAPDCVAPGESFIVEVFVHSKAARDTLLQWSSLSRARRFTAGPRTLAMGCTLDVAVSIEGIPLRDYSGQVLWDGDLGMVQFPVTLPADVLLPSYPGRATFSLDGIRIADSHFLITVGPIVGAPSAVAPTEHAIRSAFASYATGDRPAVLARIQGMQKAAPFIDIFLDVISLRSGDDWNERIRFEIKARDVLLLFWSQAASRSRYVDTEWRIALAEKGIECISPVPLESAAVAPPPPELSALHFNDWTLAVL